MTKMGLTVRFNNHILKLQEINERGIYDFDMSKTDEKKISNIGKKIKEGNLVSKCEDKHFARQLLLMNNVPEKYWGE